MFNKILIANRGEIACRVIRTAEKLGISTVAIYSDADRHALHVRLADEAIHVGAAPSSDSYLQLGRIIAACEQTGAEAVHPGYGFLSENASFAKALSEHDITFIGPNIEAIRVMGDKIESKKLAIAAGVNTIPGHTQAIENAQEAVSIANDIGYPVMLKASAGGGGKGMRVVKKAAEVAGAFEAAANEARSSFGDDRVFLEKFIEQPRHIEIQFLADQHGNIVYLGERECSIQRRHQKVIEEAPSPFIDSSTRAAMGAQAVALATAVNYVSAGTVEFIVDKNRDFYFLEMNTRLQVEHPVTEYITGLDLVEQMLRVAAGEALAFTQEDIQLNGWAMEARVYAEDPSRGFMPSIGRLNRYQQPAKNEFVRVDSGVFEGGEISVYYDPMIAKLIAYGADRDSARRVLLDAIDEYCIQGLAHNLPFVANVLQHPRFIEGDISTAFIEEEYSDGYDPAESTYQNPELLIAIAACLERASEESDSEISGQNSKPRKLNGHYVAHYNTQEYAISICHQENEFSVEVTDRKFVIRYHWQPGQNLCHGFANEQSFCVQVNKRQLTWHISHRGHTAGIKIFTAKTAALAALMPIKHAADMSKYLLSPMPGLLLRLSVNPGDHVKAGQELATIEAMKMENKLLAEQDGTVAAVHADENASLVVDQPIVEFE